MIRRTSRQLVALGFLTALMGSGLLLGCVQQGAEEETKIRFGLTPYQDTALPIIAEARGWFEEAGLDVEFVPLTWGDVPNVLSGGGIDVALYNFNSFQAPYWSGVEGGSKPIFYCATYVFKGGAIMIREDSGLEPFVERPDESIESRRKRIASTARQLRGKRIAVVKGTEFEQVVLAALEKGGLSQGDVTLIHATPEDALAAFLARDIDAFGAGLTERIEAKRHGATELLTLSDVGLPVLDGFITTERFAEDNEEALLELVEIWFRIIRYVEADVQGNSAAVRNYLRQRASTRYSAEEYSVAWTFQIFPPTAKRARELIYDPESPYYWEEIWSNNNDFLIEQGEIDRPVPLDAFWGEEVMARLAGPESRLTEGAE